MSTLEINPHQSYVYAPESFEYLLLKASLFNISPAILDQTYEYADSKDYMSWEEFYNAYLVKVTAGEKSHYNKSALNDYYRSDTVIKKVKAVLPEFIQTS